MLVRLIYFMQMKNDTLRVVLIDELFQNDMSAILCDNIILPLDVVVAACSLALARVVHSK